MAFTVTKNVQEGHAGNVKVVTGKYVSDGGTAGGDITTGLGIVLALFLQPKGSSILANQPVVNETMPKATDGITIVTTANEEGTWTAIGL